MELNKRDELKKFIRAQKEAIYTQKRFENLSNFYLYNPNYREKNPMFYLHNHPDHVQPVKLSKSFASYHRYDILYKMQEVARQLDYIVVPAPCFHWRRRKKFRETFPNFAAGNNDYIMLPESALNDNERRTYIDYLRNLDWH